MLFLTLQLDVGINMIACKTKESIEAVASAGTLITDTTVGAGGGLPVCRACWGSGKSRNSASEVSLRWVGVGDPEERLTTRFTSGPGHETQQVLLSSVVTVSELDFNFWRGRSRNINVNLNLGNCKVGEGFESILNRVRVLRCTQASHASHVNFDGTGVVLATELVNKTQLEECFRHSAFECASQLLEILTTVGLTFGFRIITSGAPTE